MRRKFDAIVAFSELEEFIDMPVKHYSSGMFARLAFAVNIHVDPDILLVDEALAVGDQDFQRKCLDRIRDMQRQGVTIVLVSHARETVQDYCTRALWLEHGHLIADGVASVVVEQYLSRQNEAEQHRLRDKAWSLSWERWGTQRVEITQVRILSVSGQEQVIFQTGDQMVVAIHYKTNAPVPPPVFGLAIHRHDGLHICGPNTGFSGIELPPLDSVGCVTYTIPFMPLLEGLYYISVASHNLAGTEVYDYHDRAYPFRVVNRPNGPVQERYGLITVQGVWVHEPCNRSLLSA
jgi:lipopolysaccharide transport system ATP-binding protein